MFREAQEQPLPPAGLRIEAGEFLHAGAYRLPGGFRINQHATFRMRSEYQRLASIEEGLAMARRDSDATLRVERDDRCSMKRSTHMACFATFLYVLPL